ncbi:MAG: Dyp-type peroxidase [Pseudomonadales bacterium]|nr:Dyp-type peroxidase [Pseudomonadales bacterium]
MTTPQPGIFVEGSRFGQFMEYTIKAGVALSEIRADLDRIVHSGPRSVNLVATFGYNLWRLLNPEAIPEGFRSFETLKDDTGEVVIPSTQGDIMLWVHSDEHDDLVDAVIRINELMGQIATLQTDVSTFVYRDSRDLTGFVDGSANPKGDDRLPVALIPDGEAGASGSFVLSQKWNHNLQAFNKLNVPEQEGVIGRTKSDSIELEGDDMPPTSHVSRTDFKENGKAYKLYRRSMPFADGHQKGLYFVAFSCELERYDVLLNRMVGHWQDGLKDRLMEFTKAEKSSFWFAPSMDDLSAALQR